MSLSLMNMLTAADVQAAVNQKEVGITALILLAKQTEATQQRGEKNKPVLYVSHRVGSHIITVIN